MIKAKKLPGFGINIEFAPPDPASSIRCIDALSKLRVEWIRLRIDYYNKPSLDTVRSFVIACQKAGIHVLITFGTDVPGTLFNVFFSRLRFTSIYSSEADFISFVRPYVSSLSPTVSNWEVLNEIDTYRFSITKPNPSQYVSLLTKVRQTILSINSNSKIVFSGLLGDGTRKFGPGHAYQFLEASIDNGALEQFDILNFHPYTIHSYISRSHSKAYLDDFQKGIIQIASWSKRFKKPAWITEYGISPRWVRLTENDIAHVYWSAYEMAKKKNIVIFFWQLIETRRHLYEPGSPEKHFGILNDDLTPKPIFNKLVELAQSH